jgi:acetyl-CoA acyltransferase
MDAIYVVGVSMTPCGKFLDKSVKDLTRDAVSGALRDAGIGADSIDAAFFSNAGQSAIERQHMIPGQIALRDTGIEGLPIVNVENACASASTAFHLACTRLRSGLSNVVLVVGAEKLYHSDKAKSFAVFDGAWDIADVEAIMKSLDAIGHGTPIPVDAAAGAGQRSAFMDVYAALARHHMGHFGTTQRQLAAVAAKNHQHSVLNAHAQYRAPYTIGDVLAARTISWPLTLPMCAPISDGASAAILVRGDNLHRFDRRRAIRVDASVLASGSTRNIDQIERHICRLAAAEAYEAAGIGPEDVSVAEVHDATAFGEIIQTENLGFCKMGEGGPLAESGATTLGGRIPVNPSGGLESKGHPIGATGLGQIYELVLQLRGEAAARQVSAAKVAVAENGGGFLGVEEAAACITILSR